MRIYIKPAILRAEEAARQVKHQGVNAHLFSITSDKAMYTDLDRTSEHYRLGVGNWGQMRNDYKVLNEVSLPMEELMSKFRFFKAAFLVAGLIFMTSSCASMARLGEYSIPETYSDPKVKSLVQAVWEEDGTKIELLASKGVDINAVGKGGATPLMWALKKRSHVAVKALLESGANPNLYIEEFGGAAINIVAGGDDPQMLNFLLQYGADPNHPGGGSVLERPLTVAANQGRIENIKILVAAGAELNAHDEFKQSAATETLGSAHFDALAYLIEQGYNYDLEKIARGIVFRVVPSGSEAQGSKQRVIEMLLDRGVKVPDRKDL
ncbi:ankyrin repeat domain-containing protein [Pseudomonas sp. NyZ704]|nr:ankyrin repeat domain-containing protein [Pseudomonas sp. NyZ704]